MQAGSSGHGGTTDGDDKSASRPDPRELLGEVESLAHVGTWTWDLATGALRWSPELHRIYGIELGAFEGTLEGFLARVYEEDRDRTRELVERSASQKEPFEYSHRIVRSDGEVRMLQTRAFVVRDERGRAKSLSGSCWDVTDWWQATEKLAHSRSLLRAALDATADGILVVDCRGKVAAYNRRFCTLWGLPTDLAEKLDDEELLSAVREQLAEPDAFLRRVRELYAKPEAESFDVVELKGGRVLERLSLPQRLDDTVVGRVWSFRDVTRRELLLRRSVLLSEASRLLSALATEPALREVTRLVASTLDVTCSIELSIARDEEMHIIASAPQSLPGGPPGVAWPSLGEETRAWSDGRGSYAFVSGLGGERMNIALRVARLGARAFDDDEMTTFGELASRVVLAAENAVLLREVQSALAAREEFLTIAAHEIRGPLTSLRFSAQALGGADLNETARAQLLEIIVRATGRINDFIEELLDMAHIRREGLRIERELVDLSEIVEHTVASEQARAKAASSSLTVETPPRVIGRWDRRRVEQVVSNLVTNAIKFGRGRPIEVRVRDLGEDVELTVADQGVGIPRDQLDAIFNAFERAVTPRHYGGLGLGLFIVRTIVESLGGEVSVASEVNKGSTFYVRLPKEPPDEA